VNYNKEDVFNVYFLNYTLQLRCSVTTETPLTTSNIDDQLSILSQLHTPT